MNVTVHIDGMPISPRQFTRQEMSVSSQRPKYDSHRYAISIPAEAWLDAMAAPYQELATELKRDDQCTGEMDTFAAAGYPPLRELALNEALFFDIMYYLKDDTVDRFCSPPYPPHPMYLLDTLTRAWVDDANFSMEGTCLRLREAFVVVES